MEASMRMCCIIVLKAFKHKLDSGYQYFHYSEEQRKQIR